ncbi:MAG: hypothetical protein ACLP50_33960 [Solirubrobacteraceae bacterium]
MLPGGSIDRLALAGELYALGSRALSVVLELLDEAGGREDRARLRELADDPALGPQQRLYALRELAICGTFTSIRDEPARASKIIGKPAERSAQERQRIIEAHRNHRDTPAMLAYLAHPLADSEWVARELPNLREEGGPALRAIARTGQVNDAQLDACLLVLAEEAAARRHAPA